MIYVPPSVNSIVFNFPGDYPNLYGSGLLSGSFPLSMLTSEGNLPSQAEIRILYRPNTGEPGDGILVATTTCNADGTWQVPNLNELLKYDIVARIPGYNDVLISDVQPTGATLSAYFFNLKEAYEYGEEVNIQVMALGGKPPYTFTAIELPEGLSIDQNTGIISGMLVDALNVDFQIEVNDLTDEIIISGESHVAGDQYWDNVVAMLNFDGDLTDETGRSWSLGSASVINTETPIFGTGSLETTGLGDGVYTSNPINDSSAAFCIETFMEIVTLPSPTNGYGASDWIALWGQTNNTANGEMGLWFQGNSIFLELRAIGGGANSAPLSTPLTTGVRYHLAHTYDGTTHRAFLNGELVVSKIHSAGWGNTSQPFRIGQMLIPKYSQYRAGGYCLFDSFRITKGVSRYTESFDPPTSSFPNFGPAREPDPYWDNVVALLHFNDNLTDETGRAWTAISGPTFESGGVNASPALSSAIFTEFSQDLDLLNSDFTIEFFVKADSWATWAATPAGSPPVAFGKMQHGSNINYWSFGPISSGVLALYAYNDNNPVYLTTTEVIPFGKLTHVALMRQGNQILMSIDGIVEVVGSVGQIVLGAANQFTVGRYNSITRVGLQDELRITKDVARYTDNFTPPTGSFSNF